MCWQTVEGSAGLSIVDQDFYVAGTYQHGIQVVAPSESCPDWKMIIEVYDVDYPELFDLGASGYFHGKVTFDEIGSNNRDVVYGKLVSIENVSESARGYDELYLESR